MDANILAEKIASDSENIITILTKLGHENIKDRGKYIQTSNLDGDNISAISIIKENLIYQNFTRNDSGNIFSLIMYDKKVTFPEALNFAARCIGYKDDGIHIKLPFGGFYKPMLSDRPGDFTIDIPVYSENDLPDPHKLSLLWIEDGVNPLTQLEYGIRYDPMCDSIIIPVHDYKGNLVGAKQRKNLKHCDINKRWSMYIAYPKTRLCYGWSHNYASIQEKKTVFIFEAEKSVGQLSSMGCNLGLAVGGHNISECQAHYINTLQADEIIIAFDEGVAEEELKFEANKLLPINGIYKNKVGFIFDGGGDVLKPGSKDSPTDNGKDAFLQLYRRNIKWIN